jgi:hypothetical protein
MATIGRLWAGHIYGTNTGKVFVEITGEGESLKGILRLNDTDYGLAVYQVAGSFDGTTLRLEGDVSETQEGVQHGHIKIGGSLRLPPFALGSCLGHFYDPVYLPPCFAAK